MAVFQKRSKSSDTMTLFEHLAELRSRLIVSMIAFVICATVAFALYQPILSFLLHPLCHVQKNCQLIALGPIDMLSIRVKIAGYGGIILSCPVWSYEIWRFVTPGLTKKERRIGLPFVASAFLLFGLGAVVAYLTYPHALRFFSVVGGSAIKPTYTANNYFNLLLALLVIFGLTFEFPVVLVGLEFAGVVTPKQLSNWRKYSVLGLLTASAVFTPSSDPFSMFAMFIPLWIFYEASIIIGRIITRKKVQALNE
jgi:sec-independent protein translocase protein TatC